MAGDLNSSTLRPAGTIIVQGPGGLPVQRETHRCCHCQKHFLVQRGSGRLRGLCSRCGGVTCGPTCSSACVNWERALDLYEKGHLPSLDPAVVAALADTLPVTISVPAAVPGG